MSLWTYYHCIRKNFYESYSCSQIEDVLKIPIPTYESHIIVISSYTPRYLHPFYVDKKLKERLIVRIVDSIDDPK